MEKIVLEITCEIALSNASGAIPIAVVATDTKLLLTALTAVLPVACEIIAFNVATALKFPIDGLSTDIKVELAILYPLCIISGGLIIAAVISSTVGT
jgi:hypothetical protein